MTTLAYARPTYRLSWTRRIVGTVGCLALVAVLVAYGLARIFTDNVFLTSHFGNVLTGVGILLVLGALISIVLFPVRNSAVQRIRPMIRFAMIGMAALLFAAAGLAHGFRIFRYDPTVVATSPDGSRRIVLVDIGPYEELHVWAGRGLATKDVGNLGAPCEFDTAMFTGNASFHVSASGGDSDIRLDPATGAPLNGLVGTCPVEQR
ncbi:MAG TPA: hypothetical protein VIR00_02535 [Micromonosporaceae bacterium]